MAETVAKLDSASKAGTSSDRPGMLLGKIQSGKTRAFIGIMAKAFDEGYDFAIVLTKGTQALSEQTMKRLARDFASAIDDDRLRVYDIIKLPKNLTQCHLRQKWIIVAKKEKNNLKRIFEALETHYPDLKEKRLLIIDDEADYATLAFRKSKDTDEIEAGKIAQWIDQLREKTAEVSFLQVTATPYSLYLQPNNQEESPLFHPVRPSFTVPLPTYPGYAGGDFFFGESDDPESPASFAFHEVSLDERDALKKQDRRSFKLEEALTSPRVAALRIAVLNFVTGGSIRRMQQAGAGEKRQKYAFMVHTESSRRSHDWQEEIVRQILKELVRIVKDEPFVLQGLIRESYEDLERSLKVGGEPYPGFDDVFAAVRDALVGDEIMVSIVNSDIVTLRPHRRLQPIGFQTGYKSYISKNISELDELIHGLMEAERPDDPVLISMIDTASILRMIDKTLVFEDDEYQWDFEGHIAALEHLSSKAVDPSLRGKVWLFVREGRNLARFREGGRYSNEPAQLPGASDGEQHRHGVAGTIAGQAAGQ